MDRLKTAAIVLLLVLLFIVVAGMTIGLFVVANAAEVPDITEPCGLTEEELADRLKYNLKPYAKYFLLAEADYEINACFIASVAALESGWGRFMHAENNIFGFGQKDFESVEKGIDYVSWYLYKHYIREDGRYYRGGTIADIGKVYCPDDGTWVRLVTGIYGGLCNG